MSGKQRFAVDAVGLSALLTRKPLLRGMPSVAVRVVQGQVENV